jgi:hypothetical protein
MKQPYEWVQVRYWDNRTTSVRVDLITEIAEDHGGIGFRLQGDEDGKWRMLWGNFENVKRFCEATGFKPDPHYWMDFTPASPADTASH